MAKVLLIIAPKDFRDEELFHPKEVLEQEGHECVIGSSTTEECVGKLGARVKPDVNVAEVDVNDFDAIVLVGGTGSLEYSNNETVLGLFKEAKDKGKIIAAICAAPAALAYSGVLEGVNATVYPKDEYIEKVRMLGAYYVKEDVVVDGRIVTANGPAAAREFGRAIAGLL